MNKHRGSDFNDFLIDENLMTPTPRTDEFARAECCDLEHALDFTRQLERELAEVVQSLAFQTQLNREVIEREKQTRAELAAEREQLALWKHEANRLADELEKLDEKAIGWWREYQDLKAKARQQ